MNYRMKFFSLILIISLIVSGCSFIEDKSLDDNISEEDIEEDFQEEISLNVGGKDYDLLIRSEGISDAVVNLFGIDNATSIIFNDMVAVAVEMADGHEFTFDVKETVINTVKEKDNTISEVLVSDDKKIFKEIESVIEALLNGKSYDQQVNKINNIIEGIKK